MGISGGKLELKLTLRFPSEYNLRDDEARAAARVSTSASCEEEESEAVWGGIILKLVSVVIIILSW